MSDARITTEAARRLARARWGTTRLDGLVAELSERSDELGPRQVAALEDVLVKAAGHTLKQEIER